MITHNVPKRVLYGHWAFAVSIRMLATVCKFRAIAKPKVPLAATHLSLMILKVSIESDVGLGEQVSKGSFIQWGNWDMLGRAGSLGSMELEACRVLMIQGGGGEQTTYAYQVIWWVAVARIGVWAHGICRDCLKPVVEKDRCLFDFLADKKSWQA